MRLKGKIAVITGAGSGIGRAMAILFAAEGARVVANDWNAKTLNEVVATVRANGGEITGVHGNVAVQAETEALIDTAIRTYDRLDILCNNAGVMDLNQGIGELTDEMWQRVLSINLNGPMFASRRAVPIMLKQGGGTIINIASMSGLGGGAAGAAYTASKHGLVGLTLNTAWIYAQKGIRCNAICPGGVKTNIMQSIDMAKFDPAGIERASQYASLMPKMLNPIDIAQMALFLASDDSIHINGAIIPVDAGWRAA